MTDSSCRSRVVRVHNLRDYFRTSIDDVVDRQGVDLDPQATQYVVNLLTLFSRSEELYEDDRDVYGLRPLALMLADAAEARTPAERNYFLQRIGDVALFIGGFFTDSLSEKPVDVDYYIRMGGNAYGSLSDEVRGTRRGDVFAEIYRELSHKFAVLIDVLNEVRGSGRESSVDILRTYEVWLKTGSARAASLLTDAGIVPITGAAGRHTH